MLGLIAAGALLIDYVMTVAVSTSSALDQIFSIAPGIAGLRVEIGILAIVLITIGNLRGLRESGNIFAIPTYVLPGPRDVIVVSGVIHIVAGEAHPLPRQPNAEPLGDRGPRAVPAPQGVRLGLGRPDRRRGDRQRGPGVQAARGQERGQHADRDVDPAGHHLHRAHDRRPRLRRHPVARTGRRRSSRSSPRRRSATGRCSTCSRSRPR